MKLTVFYCDCGFEDETLRSKFREALTAQQDFDRRFL